MKGKSVTRAILKALSKAHYGLATSRISDAITDAGIFVTTGTLYTSMSTLRRKGLVRKEPSQACEGCGRTRVIWRISDQGRIWLQTSA